MRTVDMNNLWKLIIVALAALLLAAAPGWAQTPEEIEDELLTCPLDFPECYPFDFLTEIARAHMLDPSCSRMGYWGGRDRRRRVADWELDAVAIVISGSLGKDVLDILPVDGGAHGFAHFQPPNDLRQDFMAHYDEDDDVDECIQTDDFHLDPVWVSDIQTVLYSRYSVVIQLNAWRRGVDSAVYEARDSGWEDEHLAIAAAIANSTGEYGFRRLLDSAAGCPAQAIQLYVDQRPGSNHRRRRATALRERL